ncbi:hypothetical protein GCM10027592_11230 [Spirosoma flavus]
MVDRCLKDTPLLLDYEAVRLRFIDKNYSSNHETYLRSTVATTKFISNGPELCVHRI